MCRGVTKYTSQFENTTQDKTNKLILRRGPQLHLMARTPRCGENG